MFIWIQNQFDGLIVGIISGLLASLLVYVTGKLIQRILLPKELRQKHSSALSVYRRTLSFTVKAKIDADGDFIVKGCKKNEQIIHKYFEGEYDRVYYKIIDLRKISVIRNSIFCKGIRKQRILIPVLKKIESQHLNSKKAMDCLLIDESAINSKIYRNNRYNTLLEAIIRYNVRDKISESEKIEVKFYYLKTSKNGLPHDIDLNVKIDKKFLIKYRKKIDTLYFDIKKIYNYIAEYSLENLSIDDAYKVLEGIKRNNMNIYDLDIIDFINYVAPRFYSFISIISNGEWVYSKLDIKHYRIDNFQFDLEMLYRLSSANDFFPSEQI